MNSARPFWVFVHRWVGLAMTPWLIIVALTGAVIAFSDELDAALNPQWFRVHAQARTPMDPIELHDRVEQSFAGRALLDYVVLTAPPGGSVRYIASPTSDPATGRPYRLDQDQVFLDPYSGRLLGARRYDAASLRPENFVNFMNRLHYCLALPGEHLAMLGGYVLGVAALLWTIDCFAGVYLTLPRSRARRERAHPLTSWWRRWRIAWKLKWPASSTRLNFDLHRASGLWAWALLLVLAWSSVSLNLGEVYRPTARAVLGLRTELPTVAAPDAIPRPDWRAALARGRQLMAIEARAARFAVNREDTLAFDPVHGAIVYTVWSSLDHARWPMTAVTFDARDGRFLRADWAGHPDDRPGDVFTRWIIWLHMAAVFGLPMQLALSAAGLAITALAVTGLVIWWRKLQARSAS